MISNLLMKLAGFSIQKTLILGGLLGLVYFLVWFNDGSKLESQIEKIKAEITTEEGLSAESEIAIKEVDKVRASVGALSDQFKIVSQQIPTEVQMADVIRTVDSIAKTAGVSIRAKEPRSSQRVDVFEEVPLQISAEGTFSEITMFLYYVSSTERVMRVKDFTINLIGPSGAFASAKKEKKVTLSFEGALTSYRFIGEGAAKDSTGVKK